MTERIPLVERKRNQARERIVRAALKLFLERGFDAVSVAEIADRAEVGRTTFFRYFGDKQEVVFAEEQALIVMVAEAHKQAVARVPSSSAEAIAQLRDIVLAMCAQLTQDPSSYAAHYALMEQNVELRARDALKAQDFARRLAEILIDRGADEQTAVFASQIAVACYQTARRQTSHDPRALVGDTREAFDRVLGLGRASAT